MNDDAVRERNPILWTAVGALLGLVLLYASTRQVDPAELVATLRSADPWWAAGILASTLGFTVIKACRWRLLLRFMRDPGFHRLHAAVYVGLAVNFLIAHVGEFLRAAEVARGSGTSVSAVFATVVIERLLDFIALLLLLVLVSVLAPELPAFVEMAAVVTVLLTVAAMAALYALLRTPAWLTRFITHIGGALPPRARTWCWNQIAQMRTGMTALQDVRIVAAAVLASVLQWVLVVLAIWCSVRAIGESAAIVPVTATFVLIIVGLMLPNSPMQIGTTQLAFAVGLGTAGMPATEAVAASLVYTLFLIVPIMVIGGACLMRGRRAFRLRPGSAA